MSKKKIKKPKCICGLPFEVCGHARGPKDQELPDIDIRDRRDKFKR